MADEPTNDDTGTGRKPPYPGFGAFTSLIERLAKTGVPSIIDRHFIGGSGTNQSLMMGALSYLALIDEDSQPTQELHDLAEKEDERPAVFRALVERHFQGALALGPRATQSQLDQWFRQQGVNGETARKAQSFFLSLAKAAEIEVSPHFKVTRASPATRKKAPFRRRILPAETKPAETPLAPSSAGNSQIHASVMALLERVPGPGESWTKAEKDLLVKTFDNLLDLFHPVTEPSGKAPLQKE